jgi:hypothetical protein
LRNFEAVLDVPAIAWIMRGLYYLLPNLAAFNVRAEAAHGVDLPLRGVLLSLAYAAVYIAVLLVAAVGIFRRRDFK